MKSIVLCSGGIDSAVCLAQMLDEGHECVPLWVGYGQKHRLQERGAAKFIAAHYILPFREVILPPQIFSGSTLTDRDKSIPEGTYEEQKQEGPLSTYVPFRNGVFLSIAAAVAMSEGAGCVAFGAHADDSRNYAYPDTSPKFINYMNTAIRIGTYREVGLIAPFRAMTKAEIVKLGSTLGVPFSLCYSCYNGRARHCGVCSTCLNRKKAFEEARIVDPTEYEEEL